MQNRYTRLLHFHRLMECCFRAGAPEARAPRIVLRQPISQIFPARISRSHSALFGSIIQEHCIEPVMEEGSHMGLSLLPSERRRTALGRGDDLNEVVWKEASVPS